MSYKDLQRLQEKSGGSMARHRDLKREKHIRELHNQGLSLREIAQVENISPATVYRAVGVASASELLVENRVKVLEDRIKALEERMTLAKAFMEIVARMSGFLGSTFRDQLTTILRRWPKPLSASPLAVTGRAESRKIVVVVPGQPQQENEPI